MEGSVEVAVESLVEFLTESPVLKGVIESYAEALLSTIARDYKLDITELSRYYGITIPVQNGNDSVGSDATCETGNALIMGNVARACQVETLPKHSHLPVRWLVPGCEYCAKHGNIMCKDARIRRMNPGGQSASVH